MTDSDDDEFDALIESAYAEPMMITGQIGDDDLTQVAPTPPRPGVDLGVAGSLVRTRERLRRERRVKVGPPWRDRMSVVAAIIALSCSILLGALIGGAALPGPAPVIVLGLGLLVTGSLWVLWLRYGPAVGERTLSFAIAAEKRAGRELAAALAGSPWVLLHDRRLPHSEHRVPFLVVGPGGIAVVAILPSGPYLIMTPTGVRAGEDELTSGWLPTRIWEARYLLQQLVDATARDLRFTGPVIPLAAEGYPRATKIPAGWSAEPPYRIDQYQIRRPTTLGQYLLYLPTIFAPHHVTQLHHMVDQLCEPAPLLTPKPDR